MKTDSSTDSFSQLDQQLELLCSFNIQVLCNPQGDFATRGFKKLLQSLKTTKISDSLRGSYHDEHLKKWKKYAHHMLILQGRYVCKSRNPDCESCVIESECEYHNKSAKKIEI